MTPKQRSRARVVQALYQWLVSGDNINDIELQFLNQKEGKISKAFFSNLLLNIPKNITILEFRLFTGISNPPLQIVLPQFFWKFFDGLRPVFWKLVQGAISIVIQIDVVFFCLPLYRIPPSIRVHHIFRNKPKFPFKKGKHLRWK